jgi:hypothetical protein
VKKDVQYAFEKSEFFLFAELVCPTEAKFFFGLEEKHTQLTRKATFLPQSVPQVASLSVG